MIRKKKLILSCVLWIVSIGVYASDFSAVNDNGVEIYYNILSSTDKTCEVTSGGGSSYTGSVSIPSSVLLDGNTYAVTSIGGRAFGKCSGLTSVTIPNSVTEIGDYAFSSCSGLTSVTIPNSVTSIGSYAFASCSGLTSITVEIITPLTIQEETFTEFEKPTLYVPASALEAYKSHAQWGQFKNIQAIQGAGIPNNEIWYEANAKLAETTSTFSSGLHTNAFNATIKSHTFSNGKGIITFNAAVTSIGNFAFSGCSDLTSATIPNSVTSIGVSAFSDCSGLTSIIVESGNTVYDSRDNCNAIIETKSNTLILGCKKTIIPNSVTSIGNYAFSGCSSLTSVEIPNSVTSIGGNAFYGCSGLTSVTIGNSVTSIGVNAFYGCSGLASVTIPNSVTSIGDQAFRYCEGLTSVTIPNSVTSIGDGAFSSCSGLTSIKVESGNTVYDSRDNCNAIIETKSNTLILGCKTTIIPNSVTSIGDAAFWACSGLTSVTIPNSVTSIGVNAFCWCSGLTSVTIPNSVTSIGSYAFASCSGLTSITVEIITPLTIQEETFIEFEEPTLYVPASALEAYKSHAQWGRFKNIQAIQGADIPNNEIWYTSSNGIVVTPYDSKVFGVNIVSNTYTNGKGIIKFDGNVTSIGSYAFNNCSRLTSVTIPNSMKTIESTAFDYCSGLTSVTIPNSVTSIGQAAFRGCSGLTSMIVESGNKVFDSRDNCNAIIETASNTLISGCKNTIIPNSVTSIKYESFSGCSGLTSVTIPNSVTSIGSTAFRGCSGLTSMIVESGNKVFDSRDNCNAIIETASNTLIIGCKNTTIPNSVTSIGADAFRGSGLTSVTIPNSVTSIGYLAFSDCSSLTSITVESGNKVYDSRGNCNAIIETKSNTLIIGCKNTTIPNSVTSIGRYAFYVCSGLTSVTIPNSVTSIGDDAFTSCFDLISVTIPNSVTSIGYSAFQYCSRLTNVTIGNSVTSIGSYAFYGCSRLTSITVEAITPPSIESSTFNNFEKPTLYVPASALEIYKAHELWGQFKNIQAISMSYTKEDLDAIKAQWEAEAMNMIAMIQELEDMITYFNYVKKYLLLFANDEQKAELTKLDAVLAAVPAELAEMEQGIKHYLESYLARLYNCTTDAEVEQLVAECNKMLDSYYSSLKAKFLSVEEELNALYKANVQLILSAALAAKTDLAAQLSAAGADCRTLQKLFETLKALCGTKAGMIDPSILSNETVVKFEKDLNSLLHSMESCESNYDKNVSKVVPIDVETGVALVRSMSRIYNDILSIEKMCADLKMRYEEVEKIVKSGKIVPGGTAHSWRVSNRTDIAVDFASIEEADASDMVVDGDTLYLERGTRLENQTFKKRLVIVGPGYKYDKAGQDASVGYLYAYGEGAEIIGLYVPGTISVNANNLIIRNCHLGNVSGTGTSYENENCLIHSCFIDGVIEGAGADNTDAWELSNNIFAEGAITNLDNAVLDHNTFVVSSADWCLRDVTNSVVKNNILFHKRVNPLLDCSGNTYEKNIFSTDQKLDNNKWCETLGKIIECTGDPSKEAYYQTFKDGYAREYSTDGSDCGAFGGSDPYVKGGKTGEYKSRGGEEEILSGQCGVNEKNAIEWRIDKSTGTLYLEGSGRMASYDDPKDVPWYTSAELIRHIVFDNSIIEIGAYAFSQLPNLNEAITLPGQLKAIGRGAFSGTPITSVTFEQPLDSIGYEAFLGTNLSTLYMNTVWLPYGFSSSSVRGGSGKLTVYVPKGQLERYRSHHWDSSWTDYYTLAESDYDCQWDEYYNDLEQLSGLLSDLSSIAHTLSIDAGEKSMVSLFVRNSLLSDAEKEMRVADIVKRQKDIEEWWMESEDDCKMTLEIVKYSGDNAEWNRHLGQYIWGGKCVALLENLTGFRKHMEEYIKCFGVDASYKGIGGTCGTGGNEKNVTWSLDGINGILTVTGTGAMQKGLWDYWKSALIKHVILPDGITSIDKDAFVDFKVMESLTCSATAVPKLSNNVFSNTEYDTTGTLYVPSAALELYRTATYWKDWANIRTLESDPDFPGREMAAGTLDEKATLDIEHDVYNSLGIFIQALASRGIAAESNISVASQTFSLIINSQSYTWIEQAAQALESTAKYFYMTSNGGAVFRLTFSDAFTQLHQGDMAAVLATVQSLCSHIITSGITIYIDGNSYTYDGFQVEPNDLLSLKNLYERFGGTQWHSSYQWSFASNGRNAADFPGVTFTEPDKLGYSSVKAIHLGKVGLKGDVTDWVLYLPELVSLDLSVGELQGDLTGFVSHLTKLKSLDVSYNQLTGLTHLPSSVTSLYKEGQFMYNAEGTLNALQPVKVYISDRQTQNLPSILTYSLASNSCRPSTLYIMERDNTLAGDYYGTLVPESNTDNVYGTKWVSTPYIYTYGQEHDIYLRSSDHCLYPAKLVYESGDANMSGYTDVLDVQTTITDILNPAMVPLFNKSAADTYGDSRINVQDIVCMVNIVLRNQQPEQDDATKANARARTGNTVNALYTEGEGLFVTTDTPLGAIDVELTGVSSHEVGLMLNRRDFQLISLDTEGGSRHVLFSPTGKAIPVGTTQLLRLSTASAEPVYATLSSLDATLVDAAIGLRPTGMDGLTSNLSITLRMQDGNLGVTASQTLSNVELRVMTLDGVDVYVQHLSTLQAGTNLFQTELPKGLYVTTLASADSHTVNVKLINK